MKVEPPPLLWLWVVHPISGLKIYPGWIGVEGESLQSQLRSHILPRGEHRFIPLVPGLSIFGKYPPIEPAEEELADLAVDPLKDGEPIGEATQEHIPSLNVIIGVALKPFLTSQLEVKEIIHSSVYYPPL